MRKTRSCTRALTMLAERAGTEPGYAVSIEKRIPVAAGLGGGSSDAAVALRLANELLPRPLPPAELHELAAELGADVPLFLRSGPALADGRRHDAGSAGAAARLPRGRLASRRRGEGVDGLRLRAVRRAARGGGVRGAASRLARRARSGPHRHGSRSPAAATTSSASPHAETLLGLGAFRADVTGAGPALYGLFDDVATAAEAAAAVGVARARLGHRSLRSRLSGAAGTLALPTLGRGQAVRQRVLVP